MGTIDLRIELTQLYGLNKAATVLEHAIRVKSESPWYPYAPSRFVYAFFTFNSIYLYDWETSFLEKTAVKWKPEPKPGPPFEKEQFGSLVKFCYSKLADAPSIFINSLHRNLEHFKISNPSEILKGIEKAPNETNSIKLLRSEFPKLFQTLIEKTDNEIIHRDALLDCLRFIYGVRNNIFHGRKTRIQMSDGTQQSRLLIYAAFLLAINDLLFTLAEKESINWIPPPIKFDQHKKSFSSTFESSSGE